jgi:L-threonylcarbamoyladenylate synthase
VVPDWLGGALLSEVTIGDVKTLRLSVDPARINSKKSQYAISQAAEILRSGGLVALPTETVYGLGANALDRDAVAKIFAAKQRPSWDPVIVHIAGPVGNNPMLAPLVTEISEPARRLMEAFWPGPLTLLLPRSAALPDAVTSGRPLVGVRMPAHPVAFEVIRQAGVPVAAPSANVFGHISPTSAEHVLEDLDGRIDAVLNAGPAIHGVESTVLDPNQNPAVIYRPGAISAEQIEHIIGAVTVFSTSGPAKNAEPEALPSPGVSLRHYAPRARLFLVEGPLADLPSILQHAARPHAKERLGVMLPNELANARLEAPLRAVTEFVWGRWDSPEELASHLYAGLRALDAQGCTVILCPLPPAQGLGAAIRDRLRKAAFPAEK